MAGKLQAGDARFDVTADQVRLLRFLADQLEAGRARVEMEISQERDVFDEPRSWLDFDTGPVKRIVERGATWSLSATTLDMPERKQRAKRSGGSPLLEYLDQLEATAKAATSGTWGYGRDGTHITADGFLMIRTTGGRDAAHVIAAQPQAMLVLAAKLREAVSLVEAYRAGTSHHWSDAEAGRFDRLLEIEVPA